MSQSTAQTDFWKSMPVTQGDANKASWMTWCRRTLCSLFLVVSTCAMACSHHTPPGVTCEMLMHNREDWHGGPLWRQQRTSSAFQSHKHCLRCSTHKVLIFLEKFNESTSLFFYVQQYLNHINAAKEVHFGNFSLANWLSLPPCKLRLKRKLKIHI